MCVAVLSLPGSRLSMSAALNGWTANPDGAGFAYVKNGKVEIEKGFMTYEEFAPRFDKVADEVSKDSCMLVHFRVGTSGSETKNNTHPFAIKPQQGPAGAFIHNGILFTPSGDWRGPKDDEKSDTRVVASAMNNILALESVRAGRVELGWAIGTGNKLAFLYDDNSWVIVNEKQGYWDHGIWYSNRTCELGGRRY